jgi:2-dehydropantoate 2-reductase
VANCAEMLPSAILGLPLMAAAQTPGVRAVMDAAGAEAMDAALALGHRVVPIFGQPAVEDPRELLDAVLAGYSLEDTKVAILHDWMKGRRGEGDDMSGVVARAARARGDEAPVNARLVEIGRRIERGELTPGMDNLALLLETTA